MSCNSMDFPIPASESPGVFQPIPEEDEGDLLAVGMNGPDQAAAVMYNLGPGIFVYTIHFAQDPNELVFNGYQVMSSETTLEGVLLGTLTGPDGVCKMRRTFSGEAAQ